MKVFLIGLTGAGKSTIGKLLAKKIGSSFVDLDDVIRYETNRSIDDIFEKNGEPYFRKLENQYLKKVSMHENSVISTGGGTPCFHDSMEFVKQSGISIFLYTPVHLVTERIMATGTSHRPMVKGKTQQELTDFLTLKLQERLPFYAQADLAIDTSILETPEKIVQFLVSILALLDTENRNTKTSQTAQ